MHAFSMVLGPGQVLCMTKPPTILPNPPNILPKPLFVVVVVYADLFLRDPATRTVCYYYYPPCGNSTHFEPPNAVCQDICNYLTVDLCQKEWEMALSFLDGIQGFIDLFQVPFINCSQPGAPLEPLPHCCSDAGVDNTPGKVAR
jgi:hypothetical protein